MGLSRFPLPLCSSEDCQLTPGWRSGVEHCQQLMCCELGCPWVSEGAMGWKEGLELGGALASFRTPLFV